MITMMVGIPGSGKSTWAKENRKNAVIVSSDVVRGQLFGDETCQSNNKAVFTEVFRQIKELVKDNKDVIFDACNITKRDRGRFYKEFNNYGIEAVILNTPLDVAIERNNSRDRKVPKEVIERMFTNLELPTEEERLKMITIINI